MGFHMCFGKQGWYDLTTGIDMESNFDSLGMINVPSVPMIWSWSEDIAE